MERPLADPVAVFKMLSMRHVCWVTLYPPGSAYGHHRHYKMYDDGELWLYPPRGEGVLVAADVDVLMLKCFILDLQLSHLTERVTTP